MRLAVIGTGYVGLVAGAGFADMGYEVVCCDIDSQKVERLRAGDIGIVEPGLSSLVERNLREGRLTFSADVGASIAGRDLAFIAVGTPQAEDGAADLTAFLAAANAIGAAMTGPMVVVTKSTVPVGTADQLRRILASHTSHRFAVTSNPEFLKEGDAVNDFMKPDRILVGTDDEWAREQLRSLYAPFQRTNDRILFMDARSAELTKYAANAMLATRISFMNEIANLAERVGADVEHVRRGLGADPRIGAKYLFPGAGFGGSCFPKDVKALQRMAHDADVPLEVVAATDRANARQKTILAGKIEAHLGGLTGRRIAVWGLSFKPRTDDIRESPALALIERLLAGGAEVVAHDPAAMTNVAAVLGDRVVLTHRMYDALHGADALVLVTEWPEFRRPDFGRVKALLRQPILFDGRNAWEPAEVRRLGFTYHGMGRR